MAVPPKAPAGRDPVLKDIDVGGSRRLHRCTPRTDLALRFDGTEFSDPEYRRHHARGWRREDSFCVKGSSQDNGKRSQRQSRSHLSSFPDEAAATTRKGFKLRPLARRCSIWPDVAASV